MSSPVAGAQAATPAYIIPTGPDTLAYWDDPGQTWREVAYFASSPGEFVDWVPYTTTGQSFAANAMTRDGDWTMIANKATTDRPAPQETGPEEDLLPAWTPATQNARATYTVYNEWTLSQGGWINQYGVDVVAGNTGMSHAAALRINGVVQDTVTFIPNTAGLQWLDIAPIVVASGAVVRVTLTVTQPTGGNVAVYWYQQAALFATAPTYCSLAQGSKDGAAAGTTAYGCHVSLIPGTASPDWDIVAYSGGVGGGGSGGGPITLTGDVTGSGTSTVPTTLATVNSNIGTFQGLTVNAKGLVTAAANQNYVAGGPYLPLSGGTIAPGPLIINANAAALPPQSPGMPLANLHIGAADSTNTAVLIESFGSSATQINTRHAGGTAAAPTALQNFDNLGNWSGWGHNGSAYAGQFSAQILMQANEAWTTTANGSRIVFETTPNGSTSPAQHMTLDGSGNLTVTGAINATGNITTQSSMTSSLYTSLTAAANEKTTYGFTNGNGPKVEAWGTGTAGSGSTIISNSAGSYMAWFYTDGSLQIYGANATKPGGGSWVAPSDRALKSDVTDWNTGLAEILRLKPVSYQYNNDAWNLTHTDYVGLDAEDGAAVIPEMGRTVTVPVGPAPHEGEMQPTTDAAALDHGPLLFALVNAVKELTARLEALEGSDARRE